MALNAVFAPSDDTPADPGVPNSHYLSSELVECTIFHD
jgi:hypothetical protein